MFDEQLTCDRSKENRLNKEEWSSLLLPKADLFMKNESLPGSGQKHSRLHAFNSVRCTQYP